MSAAIVESKAIWDYANLLEVTIDRPAKDVWPHFFGIKNAAWSLPQQETYLQIAGQPGEVGEVYSLASAAYGVLWFFEAIEVVPERRLVLKITYASDKNSERKLSGYDCFALSEVAGRTTVGLQQAFALPVQRDTDLQLETERQDRMLFGILQKLKRTVENDREAS
jgi:hypothetical protein